MPTFRRRTVTLQPELVDVLLTGDSETDPFLEFELQAHEIDALWREHGEYLRTEANRRGIWVPGSRRSEGV